jgi:hypothetical protein
MYTSPWESFIKNDCMGDTWSISVVTQEVLDRRILMSSAIRGLVSSTGIFRGECEDFGHMVSISGGNGYMALYQFVHLVNPIMGQTTSHPPRKTQCEC